MMLLRNHTRSRILQSFGSSLLITTALVVPFILLELFNRRSYQEAFPLLLFTFMALHALLMVLALTPALQRLRVERRLGALSIGHWAGLLVGIFLLFGYLQVVADQLPCFLGAPNCD